MRFIFFTFVVLISHSGMSHEEIYFDSLLNSEQINQKDELGRKQGKWVIFGKDVPSKGYPTDGKIEEGNYTDNRKEGVWTKYYSDGVTPRIIGEFVQGRPKGTYKKLYPNGNIKEEGTFINGKNNGTFKTYHENGALSQEKYFNDNGKEEGTQKYYYPNGQVEFEFEKKDGVNAGKAIRFTEDGQVKETTTYGENGEIKKTERKEIVDTKPKVVDEGKGGPDGVKGNMRGKTFDRNGYNKVYNQNEELWLDGKFKNGKLWNGKLYKYDSDGILLKIEVWKNGKYHSDGQL